MGVTCSFASPLSPVAALQSPAASDPASASATHHAAPTSDGGIESRPEKRLLKYFLPSTSAWVPTQQEGSKRGYNKNYLRFGRSQEDKRDGRNFLRFGRGGESTEMDSFETSENEDSIEKRNRNFLRFGRNRNFLRFGRDRNFLRFGRSSPEDFALPGGPLAFANKMNGAETEESLERYPLEEKRDGRNFLRFGRGERIGRDGNRNFLRFGRSIDHQLEEEEARHAPFMTPTHAPAKVQQGSHRAKRSASPYNQMVMPSRAPLVWAIDDEPEEEEVEIEAPQMTKRAYNRSFLRFGRNRNFLRFGKRNEDASTDAMAEESSYPRYERALQPYNLRFG